jgi:phage shock protein PspC (stress-responsive transcriptional regulator)
MNKTISINIGGFVFHIEEDAYLVLKNYLHDISNGIPENDIRAEAMQDIESRIAEIFKEKLHETRTEVVTLQHVHLAQSKMGSAHEITGISSGSQSSHTSHQYSSMDSEGGFRRLYRDSDDRIIGGVCSGLGHFFGVDPIWFRAAFAFALIAFGSGLLLYLVLLIIMPKAVTTSQKLEMRGRPVNLNEIGKRVQVAVDDIESAAKDITNKNSNSRVRSNITNFFDRVVFVLKRFVMFFGKFIAAIIWFVSMVLLISLLAAAVAVSMGWNDVRFFDVNGYNILAEGWAVPTVYGLLMMLGAPAFGIVYKTTKILFGIKGSMPSLKWILSALFLLGLVVFFVSMVATAKEFRTKSFVEANMTMNATVGDTLFVRNSRGSMGSSNEQVIISTPYYSDTINLGEQINLEIRSSLDSQFAVTQKKVARGENEVEARSHANTIQYQFEMAGDTLRVPSTFRLTEGAPYRNQKLKLIVSIPHGKFVYVDDDISEVIHKIDGINKEEESSWGGVWHSRPSGFTRAPQDSISNR